MTKQDETSGSALAIVQKETMAEYEMTIRESHLDSFGHVNNAAYLTILEEARWDLISARGYDLAKIHQLKIGPVILEVRLQFKHELRNREVIKIVTGVVKTTDKITTLRQVMINSKGEEAAIADFVVGLFDLKARKLIAYTPEWRKAIGLS